MFISDVHLGPRGCRAGFLLDFLRRVECEQLYLVGDIIDLWSLERTFYWSQQHGRHPHPARQGQARYPGGLRPGQPLLESLGCRAYSFVLRLNRQVNALRDWVESCTALVEDAQGRLSLLRWTEAVEVLAGDASLAPIALGNAA